MSNFLPLKIIGLKCVCHCSFCFCTRFAPRQDRTKHLLFHSPYVPFFCSLHNFSLSLSFLLPTSSLFHSLFSPEYVFFSLLLIFWLCLKASFFFFFSSPGSHFKVYTCLPVPSMFLYSAEGKVNSQYKGHKSVTERYYKLHIGWYIHGL